VLQETFCYSDFPVPNDFPIYPSHLKVLEYANLYAKKFNLTGYIRFNSKVIEIIQSSDFDITGRWQITLENTVTGKYNLSFD